MTAVIFEVDPALSSPADLHADPIAALAAANEFETSGTGLLTILPCSVCYLPYSKAIPNDVFATIASSAASLSPQAPISENRKAILTSRFDPSLQEQELPRRPGQIEYIFELGNWSATLTPEAGKKYGTMLQMLQYPFSRGSVHVAPLDQKKESSGSELEKPIINPRYYERPGGEIDFEAMKACLDFGDQITKTAPLSNIVTRRAWPPEGAGDEQLGEWLRENTVTNWHHVGTCSMGGSEGKAAGVVDERLKVYEVGGLRVVDASIFPLQMNAHPQATIYAAAEKAAVMILEDAEL